MRPRIATDVKREEAPGSLWSNRSVDGKHFKNMGSPAPFAINIVRTLKWQKQRLFSSAPQPPKGGYQAFGNHWFRRVHAADELRSIRRTSHSGESDVLFWIGHATSLLCIANGPNVLMDPVFSSRASPFSFAGPARRYPAATTIEELPTIDMIAISHNHYDHLDEASVRAIFHRFPGVHFVVPLGLETVLRKWNIPSSSISSLNWWEELSLGEVTLACTPAEHWSKRSILDTNTSLWCGWCIGWGNKGSPRSSGPSDCEVRSGNHVRCGAEWHKLKKFYFAGDTAFNQKMFELIHVQYGDIDMAALPIGAYSPRWFMQAQHIDPEQAVRIFQLLRIRQAIAVHWGTFELADEPLDEPPAAHKEALDRTGIPESSFRAIQMGRYVLF